MSSWSLIDILTVTHNALFIGLLFVAWMYVFMKSHQMACMSRFHSGAISLYILTFVFVLAELAFCVVMLNEYNKIKNPDESISNAKTGLYVEIGLLSIFSFIGIQNLFKLFKGTYCR
jgi:hypothetical protein